MLQLAKHTLLYSPDETHFGWKLLADAYAAASERLLVRGLFGCWRVWGMLSCSRSASKLETQLALPGACSGCTYSSPSLRLPPLQTEATITFTPDQWLSAEAHWPRRDATMG